MKYFFSRLKACPRGNPLSMQQNRPGRFSTDARSQRGCIVGRDFSANKERGYEAAGVQELVITFSDAPQLDTLRWFARAFIL